MPAKDQAEYMRNYRAAKKGVAHITQRGADQMAEDPTSPNPAVALVQEHRLRGTRILELEEEVRRLKQLLAAKSEELPKIAYGRIDQPNILGGSFGQSRPAPKPGKKK